MAEPTNRDVIRDIVAAVDMQCELGGGVRDQATIDDLLNLGLHRLVLGTTALKNADWFREMCETLSRATRAGDRREKWLCGDRRLARSEQRAGHRTRGSGFAMCRWPRLFTPTSPPTA